MKLDCHAITHIGRREDNQDSLWSQPDLGAFAVADGMGGYAGGGVASRLAIDSLAELVHRAAADDDATWPYAMRRDLSADENLIAVAFQVAQRRIAARRTGALANMGSTLAALAVRGDTAVVGHVGDSRVYRLRGGALTQLTRDHSAYEELLAVGVGDLPPRHEFAHRNMITRALGPGGAADVQTVAIAPGDVFLLCTDGVTEIVGDARIAVLLARETAEDAARAIVEEAYAGGGRDNITAIVVRCLG